MEEPGKKTVCFEDRRKKTTFNELYWPTALIFSPRRLKVFKMSARVKEGAFVVRPDEPFLDIGS